jgi:hypothetical protein
VLAEGGDYLLDAGGVAVAAYDEALLKQRIVDEPSASLKTSLDTLVRIAAFARQEPTVLLPAHDPLAEHRLTERITLTG